MNTTTEAEASSEIDPERPLAQPTLGTVLREISGGAQQRTSEDSGVAARDTSHHVHTSVCLKEKDGWREKGFSTLSSSKTEPL